MLLSLILPELVEPGFFGEKSGLLLCPAPLLKHADNNNTADAPISVSSVKGKLVFSVPFLGAVVRVLQTTAAKIILLLLAAFLLRLSWRKEKQADDDELDRIKAEIRRLKAEQYPESEPSPAAEADPSSPKE